MTEKKFKDGIAVANASGYPLEAALVSHAKRQEAATRFYVLYREHPWIDPVSGEKRFLDFVLGGQVRDTTSNELIVRRLVVECKRVEGKWVFPVAQSNSEKAARARVPCGIPASSPKVEWRQIQCGPEAYESEFCALSVKRGDGFDSDRRTLEAWAGELVRGAESLAQEEEPFVTSMRADSSVYIPVVVTTAELEVVLFEPERVDLSSGWLSPPPDSTAESVGWVRFSRNLGLEPLIEIPQPGHKDPHMQTTWVVQASAFMEFVQASAGLTVGR